MLVQLNASNVAIACLQFSRLGPALDQTVCLAAGEISLQALAAILMPVEAQTISAPVYIGLLNLFLTAFVPGP